MSSSSLEQGQHLAVDELSKERCIITVLSKMCLKHLSHLSLKEEDRCIAYNLIVLLVDRDTASNHVLMLRGKSSVAGQSDVG